GEVVKIGDPFVTYQGGNGTAAPPKDAPRGTPARASHDDAVPSTVPERTEDAGTVVGQVGSTLAGVSSDGKALATPAVRRIARDLGVDINNVAGTGIGGRVTEKDVRAASGGTGLKPVSGGAAADRSPRIPLTPPGRSSTPPASGTGFKPVPPIPQGQETQRIPVRGVRRNIAQALRHSVNQAVHFNVMDEADVSALDDLRRRLASASGE
ncbi:MAG: E3 binding domain-containing protein, partial [Phycisphaerales bacterium]|nr:E3 binding domain-containing protein [Phycisphaerales bacterium]